MLKFKDLMMDGEMVDMEDFEIQNISINDGKILIENIDGLIFETDYIERAEE